MTPATKLTEEEAALILRSYNLRLHALEAIPRGTINSNYWVQTEAGPAFLRVNEGKTAADASFEAELIWHLGSHGVPTPQLWRTRASEPFVMWRRDAHAVAQPVMLMTWIAGHELSAAELSVEHTRTVGALLGQLHLCAAEFRQTRSGIYTLGRMRERLRRLGRDERAVREVGPLLEQLTTEAQALADTRRRDLPAGIGHGDLFPDNLLFADRRPAPQGPAGWILDLEQAAHIPYLFDLAVALLSFAPRPLTEADPAQAPAQARPAVGPLDRARARALLDGYQTMRVLTEVEWDALSTELRWAALRFTTTRLTDVAGYGKKPAPASSSGPGPGPGPGNDETAEAKPASRPRKRRPRGAPLAPAAQSKDYREFARMLAELRALAPQALTTALR